MLVVAAVGGNALLRSGEPADAETQRRNVTMAVDTLAQLATHHRVVVTHGNAPQVGLLGMQAGSERNVAPYPLDVLGAESDGMIGYLLEQGLGNRLPGTPTATLLTQVVVDEHDPAFQHPSKPIGPTYDRKTAERLARERHWTARRAGGGWRRVIPSPEPQRIVEIQTIRMLVNAGVLVVCVGGGGVPVTVNEHGALHGVEAVIDKDRSAALLAREIGADALLLLTDVLYVERNHATNLAHPIHKASASELDPAEFAGGSMRPKIEAACRFATDTGKIAAIGALSDAVAILAGHAGTQIVAENIKSPIAAIEHAFQRLDERSGDLDKDIHTATPCHGVQANRRRQTVLSPTPPRARPDGERQGAGPARQAREPLLQPPGVPGT